MLNNTLGRPEDELFGISLDFMTKLHNGTISPKEAKSFLRKQNPWPAKAATPEVPVRFPTLPERNPWLILDLPVYASKEAFTQAVTGAGHEFSEYALSVIGHENWKLLTEGGKYGFWEYTVRELTGKNKVKTPLLYEAIHFHQFIKAPQQSAGDIRVKYPDQPLNQRIPVMSDPVPDSDGNLAVLDVERDSRGSWVYRYYAYPGSKWDGGVRLLVCRQLQ